MNRFPKLSPKPSPFGGKGKAKTSLWGKTGFPLGIFPHRTVARKYIIINT